jgi:hypothetical protein
MIIVIIMQYNLYVLYCIHHMTWRYLIKYVLWIVKYYLMWRKYLFWGLLYEIK